MGRRGEVDKFGLQILYSGSIEGTDISMNSFYKCNQRCITINGSGNITILGNVGVSNYGHCIHSGPSSRDNIIRYVQFVGGFMRNTSSSSSKANQSYSA